MADFNFIAPAAAGEPGGRSGRQSVSGFDADSGTNFDLRSENYRDHSGYHDYRRMDDGHSARVCGQSVRHDAANQRRAMKSDLSLKS